MKQQKFIITMDGYLRLGMVHQHKDLLKGDDECIGGGYYQFDWASNRLVLDRMSIEFGRPLWHLLTTLKVPASYRGLRIVYLYDDLYTEDFNVSENLQIEYYGPHYKWLNKLLQFFSFFSCSFPSFSVILQAN